MSANNSVLLAPSSSSPISPASASTNPNVRPISKVTDLSHILSYGSPPGFEAIVALMSICCQQVEAQMNPRGNNRCTFVAYIYWDGEVEIYNRISFAFEI
jgi:hypothetical protein